MAVRLGWRRCMVYEPQPPPESGSLQRPAPQQRRAQTLAWPHQCLQYTTSTHPRRATTTTARLLAAAHTAHAAPRSQARAFGEGDTKLRAPPRHDRRISEIILAQLHHTRDACPHRPAPRGAIKRPSARAARATQRTFARRPIWNHCPAYSWHSPNPSFRRRAGRPPTRPSDKYRRGGRRRRSRRWRRG